VAFAGALVAFFGLWATSTTGEAHVSTAYTWLAAGNFEVPLQIQLDTLSSTMMLVVSGVGGLIVWYSLGYMEGDDEERRYFAYKALFVFSMLLLVEAGNFLLLLVGWGLVGLASYLLIGFWHQRPEAVAAAKKAFVMNAIGDATFALGLVLLVWKTGTLSFLGVFDRVDGLDSGRFDVRVLRSDFRQEGDVAAVWLTTRRTLPVAGASVESDWIEHLVLRRIDGEWRILSVAATQSRRSGARELR
jgi:NADH-quinone oxidoreductase subunit L